MKHTSPSSDGVAAVVKVLNLVSDGVLTIIVSFHLMIEYFSTHNNHNLKLRKV